VVLKPVYLYLVLIVHRADEQKMPVKLDLRGFCTLVVVLCTSSNGWALNGVTLRQNIQVIATAGAAAPPDYKKPAAKVILDKTNYKIRDAQISTVTEMWAGLLHGGNLPGVCVVIFRDNPFGHVVLDVWQITFKDGQVATASYANIQCGNTTKFNEVLKP
jgi:hypothetical protein